MAASSGSPSVVAVVDEAAGTVSVGVVEGKKFLPVASADLAHARARDVKAPGKSKDKSGDEEGGE